MDTSREKIVWMPREKAALQARREGSEHTLLPNSQPSERWENTFLCKPPYLSYLVMAVQAYKHKNECGAFSSKAKGLHKILC